MEEVSKVIKYNHSSKTWNAKDGFFPEMTIILLAQMGLISVTIRWQFGAYYMPARIINRELYDLYLDRLKRRLLCLDKVNIRSSYGV